MVPLSISAFVLLLMISVEVLTGSKTGAVDSGLRHRPAAVAEVVHFIMTNLVGVMMYPAMVGLASAFGVAVLAVRASVSFATLGTAGGGGLGGHGVRMTSSGDSLGVAITTGARESLNTIAFAPSRSGYLASVAVLMRFGQPIEGLSFLTATTAASTLGGASRSLGRFLNGHPFAIAMPQLTYLAVGVAVTTYGAFMSGVTVIGTSGGGYSIGVAMPLCVRIAVLVAVAASRTGM